MGRRKLEWRRQLQHELWEGETKVGSIWCFHGMDFWYARLSHRHGGGNQEERDSPEQAMDLVEKWWREFKARKAQQPNPKEEDRG